MEQETLATELLKELKASATRWFVAFIVALVMWFITIGIFIWYLSLPTDSISDAVTVENEDGNANYIGHDMNGELNNGENNSEKNSDNESKTP